MYSVLCALTWRPMPTVACSKLCSCVSAWLGVLPESLCHQRSRRR